MIMTFFGGSLSFDGVSHTVFFFSVAVYVRDMSGGSVATNLYNALLQFRSYLFNSKTFFTKKKTIVRNTQNISNYLGTNYCHKRERNSVS